MSLDKCGQLQHDGSCCQRPYGQHHLHVGDRVTLAHPERYVAGAYPSELCVEEISDGLAHTCWHRPAETPNGIALGDAWFDEGELAVVRRFLLEPRYARGDKVLVPHIAGHHPDVVEGTVRGHNARGGLLVCWTEERGLERGALLPATSTAQQMTIEFAPGDTLLDTLVLVERLGARIFPLCPACGKDAVRRENEAHQCCEGVGHSTPCRCAELGTKGKANPVPVPETDSDRALHEFSTTVCDEAQIEERLLYLVRTQLQHIKQKLFDSTPYEGERRRIGRCSLELRLQVQLLPPPEKP